MIENKRVSINRGPIGTYQSFVLGYYYSINSRRGYLKYSAFNPTHKVAV